MLPSIMPPSRPPPRPSAAYDKIPHQRRHDSQQYTHTTAGTHTLPLRPAVHPLLAVTTPHTSHWSSHTASHHPPSHHTALLGVPAIPLLRPITTSAVTLLTITLLAVTLLRVSLLLLLFAVQLVTELAEKSTESTLALRLLWRSTVRLLMLLRIVR